MFSFAPHPFAAFATNGAPSYLDSQPSSSFSPYHCTSAPKHAHYYREADSPDESSDDLDRYYEYLDAARRARERKKLEEAQARRHAQEQAYYRAKAQAEHEAKMKERLEEQMRFEAQREYEYRQRQRPAALEYRARQEAEYKARKEAEYRAAMEAKARLQARAEQEQKAREQEQQRIRHAQAAYQEDLMKHLFGAYLSQCTQASQEQDRRQTSPVSAPSQPASTPVQHPSVLSTQTPPQIERRGSHSSSSSTSSSMSCEQAVAVIQSFAKQQIVLRRRIGSVKSIRSRFESVKSEFSQPESLVFDTARSSATNPVLAYAPANRPFQAYEEALTRLLTDLDAISSQGSDKVKKERRSLAKTIQAELDRLDSIKLDEWTRQNGQKEDENEKITTEQIGSEDREVTSSETDAHQPASEVAVADVTPTVLNNILSIEQPQTSSTTDEVAADIEETVRSSSNSAMDIDQDQENRNKEDTPMPSATTSASLPKDLDGTDAPTNAANHEYDTLPAPADVSSDDNTPALALVPDTLIATDPASLPLPASEVTTPVVPIFSSSSGKVDSLSIPGLISRIVQESYDESNEQETKGGMGHVKDGDTGDESSSSDTDFEML